MTTRKQWNEPAIRMNQLGFTLGQTKAFTSQLANGRFEVVNVDTDETVYKGKTGPLTDDASAGIPVSRTSLDGLDEAGRYRIVMEGGIESETFTISPRPYQQIKLALLKNFYYMRCGMELTEEFAGPWKHGACHLAHGEVHGDTDTLLPSAGGWHDAGDYGKYMVAAAKAVADLMLAYERYPEAFEELTVIPESGNGIPDILNETRYELDWMLLNQRQDGAVYHKLTTYAFTGLNVMPEDDLADLVFSPVSFTAAGTFAASMAMAARVYAPFDAAFARVCQEAAERSWQWLEQADEQERTGFRNPSDVTTGEYGDETVVDELYWAAAELYRLTGEAVYLNRSEQLAKSGSFPLCPFGWADVGGYGTTALIAALRERGENRALLDDLQRAWLDRADELLTASLRDGFGVALPSDGYIWGSNMIVMNDGMHLLMAADLTEDAAKREAYCRAAQYQWDYLLGNNVLGICYVTGFGSYSVMHPHHRPSVADGVTDPVPGIVAGGPNAGLQDEIAASRLKDLPPAACYIDHEESYSTNENTIYWNSPAVYVAAALDMQHQA
ncbi:glycoside hydrolase family 9 protein [Paenibacillus xylaniclasticus]|uniref:glycoside hydrolase family 9 protein n=1 Tax=Paenibacillus xylaniclasticus TaxID=588083 RepID=UPI000FD9B356|nr:MULTISPECIES: glycoside hydrolase family 9 protein [Paenibacillus]GFN29973.1 endoglucanase [Paenibacillus curdlanolyticus]